MKFEIHSAPHIRSSNSNIKMLLDVIVMLFILYAVSVYYYGIKTIYILLVSVASGVATHIVTSLLLNKKVNPRDYSSIVTSMIIGLLMPIDIPFHIIVLANIFAIFVAKYPFGGTGQNVFNPAACGLAMVIITFSTEIFQYRDPFTYYNIQQTNVIHKSLAYNMSVGGIPQNTISDILIGNVPSAIGVSHIYLLIACMLYLIVRKDIRIRQIFFTLLSLSIFAYFFPRTNATGLKSVFYEVCAMPTIFFMTFLLTDPVTTPVRGTAMDIYAVLSGIVIMLFRHFSVFEISEPFAILVLNFMVPCIDSVVENIHTKRRRRSFAKRQNQRQRDFIKNN